MHGKTDDKERWHCHCHLLGSEGTGTWRTAWAQLVVSWRGSVAAPSSQAPLDHTVTLFLQKAHPTWQLHCLPQQQAQGSDKLLS